MIHSFLRILVSFPAGAMVGWILVAPLLQFAGRGPREPLKVILFCGVVAVAIAVFKEYQRFSRKNQIRLLARKMSLLYSAKGNQRIDDRLKSLIGRDGIFALENVMQGGRGGTQLLIGDLVDVGAEEHGTSIQTVVYFTAPDLYFPHFALQPEGRLLNFVGELVGLPDIDFSTHPEFSSSYHLSSSEMEVTRELFEADLLKFFTVHPGWEIRAEGEFMMLARGSKVPVPEWESLLDESQQILSLFQNRLEQLLQSSPEVEREPHPIRSPAPAKRPHAQRSWDGGGEVPQSGGPSAQQSIMGSLAARAAKRAVHPDEVEEFLHSPTPRRIPDRILEQTTVRATHYILVAFFAIWAVMGLPWLIIGALTLDRGGIDAIIIGLLIELVAAVALNFTIGYRRGKQKLLRNGVLTRATITDIKHTNVETNGRQRYVALVRYKAGEQQMDKSISLYGRHVDLAHKDMENAEGTLLLYDPEKPQNCLLGLQLTSRRIRL